MSGAGWSMEIDFPEAELSDDAGDDGDDDGNDSGLQALRPAQIRFASLQWPALAAPRVFHVGRLDPGLKGRTHNRHSLEGHGLSVSMHPDAWRRIARLGGEPDWTLLPGAPQATSPGAAASTSPESSPLVFLDVHALQPEHERFVVAWAMGGGLLQRVDLVEIVAYDEELGDRMTRTYVAGDPSLAAELAEAEEAGFEVIRRQGVVATPELEAIVGFQVHPRPGP